MTAVAIFGGPGARLNRNPVTASVAACAMREKAGLNTVAVVCIVGCVTTWEIMAIVTSGALEGWPCPAAYTYAVHSCYFFGLPVWMLCVTYERSWSEARARAVAVWRRLWWKTFLLASLSAGCAYAWYLSLQPGMTNVPTNNTIYQSQCGFVFALSVCFLGEEVTLRKVGAVAVAFAGVACVSAAPTKSDDGRESGNSIEGVALAIGSTATYAVYEVCYSKWADAVLGGGGHGGRDGSGGDGDEADETGSLLRSEERDYGSSVSPTAAGADSAAETDTAASIGLGDERDALLVLGMVGLCTLLSMWVVVLALSASGAEPYLDPPASNARKVMTVCILDLLFNGFLLVGISASSPLTVTVGTMSIIPVGFAVDVVRNGYTPSVLAMVGSVAVLFGIIVLNTAGPHHAGTVPVSRGESKEAV